MIKKGKKSEEKKGKIGNVRKKSTLLLKLYRFS